jgi:hypothetical protein
MRRAIIVTTCLFALAGCSADQPSEAEVNNAMAKYTDQKGCASSVLFKEFPIKPSHAKSNQDIIKLFANVGLIEGLDGSYALTDLGKEAYDPSMSGFCYTDNFTVSSVQILKKDNDISSSLTGAWYVSFEITPNNVSDWVKNEELINSASRLSEKNIEDSQKYTVRVGKKVGSDELLVIDPRFSFQPGLSYNMSW